MRTRHDLTPWRAVVAVTIGILIQASPVGVMALVGFVSGAIVESVTGATALRVVAQSVLGYVAGAIIGSFVIHEIAHIVAAASGRGRARFTVQITMLRCSVVPQHAMTRRRTVGAALAGPATSAAAGIVLALCSAPVHWVAVFLGHAIFLLPWFGDGRSVLAALDRRASTPSSSG